MMGMCGMGGMHKMMGLLAIIPAALLVTVSFFVLVVLRKLENSGLKIFGYVVCALLWLSALLIFSGGVFSLLNNRQPMPCMMQEMRAGRMPGMMEERMHEMQEKKGMMMKDKPGSMDGCMGNPAAKR